MVESPSANIAVSDADQQKLKLVDDRLKVVQAEVLAATNNLANLESEYAATLKNKEYYDQQYATVKTQVEQLTKERDSLTEEVGAARKSLHAHTQEHASITSVQESRKAELDLMNHEISLKAEESRKESTRLAVRAKALEEQESEIRAAYTTLRDAIGSLPERFRL